MSRYRINPGELRNKINILNYDCIDGVYKFNFDRELLVKSEIEFKRKNYSRFGIGADEVNNITMRYRNDISKLNAIEFNGAHYLISSVEDIENRHMYLELVAIKQKLWLCEAFRNLLKKDEMNRPKQVLESVYRFQGYLLEKYSGYDTEKVGSITNQTMILMTPKEIELKSGDIVEINSIRYNVELIHILDDYFNEYEIVVTKDV